MNWLSSVSGWLRKPGMPSKKGMIRPESPRVVVTAEGMTAITNGLATERAARHEGIVYLLGVVDGSVTLIVGAIRPTARTTAGSFEVSSRSMALVVRTASNAGLYVVGQLHSHPGPAYHSEGDELGAQIRFPGFTSIVVPCYGDTLPDLTGAAVFVIDEDGEFQERDVTDVTVLPRGAFWQS